MQVAIIAGGLATRLGHLTENQPKSLIKIHGKPFIEYQFEFLKKSGVNEVVLCLGHLGKQIEEYCGDGTKFGVHLNYSYENEQLGTAGALKLAEPLLKDTFFTLYGDSYVSLDFRDMLTNLQYKGKLAAMSIYRNYNQYDKSNAMFEDDLITHYSKDTRNHMECIEYGVNLFHKEVLVFTPASKPCSMGALFQQLIDRKELLAYEVKERFYQIGSIEGLSDFSMFIGGQR